MNLIRYRFVVSSTLLLLFVAGGCRAPVALDGTPPHGEVLLNSERIAQRYGNYGVEVLQQEGAVRVSSLYSFSNGKRVCRTYAVVEFLTPVDPRLAAVHRRILAGASLGATLAASGWHVTKSRHFLAEVPATARVATLMDHPDETRLAVDVYVLTASRQAVAIDYALIAEIHHPGYLTLADLEALYGRPADGSLPHAAVMHILTTAQSAMR
jgi:hypothetical protein